jgi:DNA-binding IclR family transcriptional regulator
MVTLRDCDTPTEATSEAAQATRAVVEKAFTILEAWDHRREIVGVSELARRTGLAKTTAHRLLRILESSAVIERVEGGYRCGDRLDGLADLLYPAHQPELRDVVLPFLQDLYELSHETVHLAILRDTEVHLVEKLYGHRRSPLRTRVGGVLPVHSTALGKALLAYSPRTTQQRALATDLLPYTPATLTQPLRIATELRLTLRQGVAYDRQETHHEVTCIAAPVLNSDGTALGAISLSGPTHRFNPAAVVIPLRRAARAASLALAATHTDAKAA